MNKYLEIKDFLRKNFNTTGHKNLVRADITFNTKVNSIGKHVEATLSKAFEKLLVIHQQSYNPSLENFKKRFYERYEEQEVPLLVALDSEIGIGYEDQLAGGKGYLPLLDGLNLDLHHKERKIEWNDWKSFILRKYSHALFHHDQEIILTDKDLDFLKEDNGKKLNMPGTFAAFGNLLAESEQALDRGDFLFNLHSISGPSCGNLLTRFCHGDEDLNEKIKNCLKLEESHYPDAIVAEIVHLPDEISGNILKRPSFRKFEIPFLSHSSVDEDFQIPLNDLMISVRYGKEIILRSRKHNKRVLPRLTNAHNFGRGTSIYRFLCDLQFEGQEINIRWHWSFLEKELFLPRVRYKNIILSRATWTWSIEDYPELRKENIDLYVFFQEYETPYVCPGMW